MSAKTFFCSETLVIELFYSESIPRNGLAYVFTPSFNRTLEGNPYGGKLLASHGFDVIVFKTIEDDWFQSVPESVFSDIDRFAAEGSYCQRIAYGSSMGGYAAIAFSKMLHCDLVVALSPQFSITQSYDTRWLAFSRNIQFKYLIDENSVSKKANFIFVFDNKDLDALHIQRISQLIDERRVGFIKLPFVGHPAVHYLSEVGVLKDFVLKIIFGEKIDIVDLIRRRRGSRSYLNCLAENLQRRKHFSAALSSINLAIQIDPNSSPLFRRKSSILESLGDIDSAIDAIKKAIAIDPLNSHSHHFLAYLLERRGLFEEAVAAAEIASDLAPDDVNRLMHFARLLLKIGKRARTLAVLPRIECLMPNSKELAVLRSEAAQNGEIDVN